MQFIVIILCAIAILIIVFVVVFGSIPDAWEWVGIVLGAFGIATGVPAVFKVIYSRPKLLTMYDRYVQEQERCLMVFLKNEPISERSILNRLGVKRDTIASLSASFRMQEKDKVIIPIMHTRIYSDDDPTETGSWRIALPPTFTWSTTIMIAMWDNVKKKAIVLGDRLREPVELSGGIYRVDIIYLVNGQERIEFREFIVGKKADDLVWVKKYK